MKSFSKPCPGSIGSSLIIRSSSSGLSRLVSALYCVKGLCDCGGIVFNGIVDVDVVVVVAECVVWSSSTITRRDTTTNTVWIKGEVENG